MQNYIVEKEEGLEINGVQYAKGEYAELDPNDGLVSTLLEDGSISLSSDDTEDTDVPADEEDETSTDVSDEEAPSVE